jgi:hypothetical protein
MRRVIVAILVAIVIGLPVLAAGQEYKLRTDVAPADADKTVYKTERLTIDEASGLAWSKDGAVRGTLGFTALPTLAAHGDVCAANEVVVRDATDTANVCAGPYAGSSTEGGAATTAVALAGDPSPCPTGPPQQYCIDTDETGLCICGVIDADDLPTTATPTATLTATPTVTATPTPTATVTRTPNACQTSGGAFGGMWGQDADDAPNCFDLPTATATPTPTVTVTPVAVACGANAAVAVWWNAAMGNPTPTCIPLLTPFPTYQPGVTPTPPYYLLSLQEGDVEVEAQPSSIDFAGGDFDVTESPEGEVNVALASGVMRTTTSVQTSQMPTVLKPDDTMACWGTDSDMCIEYDENGTDEARMTGATLRHDNNVALSSGKTFTVDSGATLNAGAGTLIVPYTAATPHPAPTAAGAVMANTVSKAVTVGTGAGTIPLHAHVLLCSGNFNANVTDTQFFSHNTLGGLEGWTKLTMPLAGTVRNLYCKLNGAPDNGAGTQSYTYTMRLDGASASVTCAISEAATSCNDTTNSFTFTAGQTLGFMVAPASTPTQRYQQCCVALLLDS